MNALISTAIFFGLMCTHTVRADVHVVFYATCQGKTGHAGIAVDEYEIRVLDCYPNGQAAYCKDTVKTGFITYFDLWPLEDKYKARYSEDVAPAYYRLPSSKWKNPITLKRLIEEGIPHKEGYPADGVFTFPTRPADDFRLLGFLRQKMNDSRAFNAVRYNCCDFVAEAVQFLSGKPIHAKEAVFGYQITTPNALYKRLMGWKEILIQKDAGASVQGSFLQERILHPLISSVTTH